MTIIRETFRRIRGGCLKRSNTAALDETVGLAGKNPGARGGADPQPKPEEYDVLVVGGGPAGLAAAFYCGRKRLRTAVFERDSWGGILTRWCPDKRIDNYPGVSSGILARDLAGLIIDDARRTGIDLFDGGVEEITSDREVSAGPVRAKGEVLILASGSTAAEAGIVGERKFGGARVGVHYLVRDPADFRGKDVVVVGGGDSGISVVERLSGVAGRVTLVHRKSALRTQRGLPEVIERIRGVRVLLDSTVEEIAGDSCVEYVRVRNAVTEEELLLEADAVVMTVGRKPNTAIFRDLDLALDAKGQVQTDRWQRTNVPGVLAVGDVSSHLKMIVTAVAQAATAAHQAFLTIRAPYWE